MNGISKNGADENVSADIWRGIAPMSIVRTIAERLSRNRLVRRKLPNGVAFYVTPDSQLKYLKRSFDEDLIRLAADRVDSKSAVWDVGANCGVFAFSCAHAREIVAIEADPFLCATLQRSVSLNGVPVAIVSGAVSSSVSLAEFSIASRGRASNFLTYVGGRSQTAANGGGCAYRHFRLTVSWNILGRRLW